ncbi:MAG TPA: hypothetical protein VMY05_09895 [Acidobacteriota bacterium]|nr:hypothetical protein [Acidobacteriota bacterium]
MSFGSYLLARFDDHERLLPALEVIRGLNGVARWDAVEGHHNLIIKLDSSDGGALDAVKRLDGLLELKRCEILADNDAVDTRDVSVSRSYAFMDIDSSKKDALTAALTSNTAVAFVSPTAGGCDMAAMVTGESFDDIDRTINEQIRPLDGVLRIKQDRLIDLENM